MPTIVKPGEMDWPYRVTHRCANCGTEYRLDKGDRFDRLSGDWVGMVLSYCPTCDKPVYTKSSYYLR